MTRPRRLRPRQREAGRDREFRPGGSASPSSDENSEDSKLRHLAFMALAANVLKPGTSTAESQIRRFQDEALRALASQAREANDGRGNPQQLAFVELASQILKPGNASKESLIRESQDQALLALNSLTLNSEDLSTDHQSPQNKESMALDSQSHSDNGPNTGGRDSRAQSPDLQLGQAVDNEPQGEDRQVAPRSGIAGRHDCSNAK